MAGGGGSAGGCGSGLGREQGQRCRALAMLVRQGLVWLWWQWLRRAGHWCVRAAGARQLEAQGKIRAHGHGGSGGDDMK